MVSRTSTVIDRGPWDGRIRRTDEWDRAMMMAEVEVKATGDGWEATLGEGLNYVMKYKMRLM